jgi:hypothetical protein
MLNLTSLNQRVNALTAKINNIVPPTSSNLADVLLNGNNAGATDIDMNNKEIINVATIEVIAPAIDQKNTITNRGIEVIKISNQHQYMFLGETTLRFFDEPTEANLTSYGKTQMEISNLAGTSAVTVNDSSITFLDPLTNGYSKLDINSLDFADATGTVVNTVTQTGMAVTGAGTISATGGLTIPSAVDFTNALAPTCLANPIDPLALCNKQYVDSQAALTAYQLFFNYTIPYIVPGGGTYSELSPVQIPTPTQIDWTTNSTTAVLVGSFFNSLIGLNIPTSIPAGVWTLLVYAHLHNSSGLGRESFFYRIYGTATGAVENLLYESPRSSLLNIVSPLIGTVSVQGTVPLTSLVGYTGLGIKLYIEANTNSTTTGSVFYQKDDSYSSILTSFASVQSPDLLNLNNTWTGANEFTSTLIGNLTGTTTNLAGGLGGQIPYQSAVNTTALLANGTASQVLTSAGTTLPPTWTTLPTTIATATNLAGGTASQIPYQSSAGVTSFIPNGTLGQVLTSAGTSVPTWGSAPAANLGAVMAVGASASTALNMATFAITNAGAIGSGAITTTADSTINTMTVGLGGGAITTNVVVGAGNLLNNVAGGVSNTALGFQASRYNTTGIQNVSVGRNSLGGTGLTTLSNNTGCGFKALFGDLITGGANTSLGAFSGNNNTSGAENTYLGMFADQTAVTGGAYNKSTAIGYNSKITASNQIQMGTNTETTIIPGFISSTNVGTGTQSVNFGIEAGKATSAGVQAVKCVAIGNLAGRNQQQNSTHIGYGAGQTNPGGYGVAIGANAGNISQGGTSASNGACVAVGSQAGYNFQSQYAVAVGQWSGINRQGVGAVAIGFAAGQGDLTLVSAIGQGAGAVAIGQYAGEGNSTVAGQGANSVAIGNTSGRTTQGTNCVAIGNTSGTTTQGNNCVAIGNNAGNDRQLNFSVAIGSQAGATQQSLGGTAAVAVGNAAGNDRQGSGAVAVGNAAGQTTQGQNAIAIGTSAGNGSLAGQGASAIAVGNLAGFTTQGANSVAIGSSAGQTSQQGSAVALGNLAGNASQGASTVAVGNSAGQNNQVTGAIAIGFTAGQTSQLGSAIAIGNTAGKTSQGFSAIAIGTQAGQGLVSGQGTNAIAIGSKAGESSQIAGSICLNATGVAVNPSVAGFFVSPIRVGTSGSLFSPPLPAGVLYYNAGEILITGP